MKHRHLWVSIIAIFLFGFLLSQDALARLAWQKYGRTDVVLGLLRGDSALAIELGEYCFNGTAERRLDAFSIDAAA